MFYDEFMRHFLWSLFLGLLSVGLFEELGWSQTLSAKDVGRVEKILGMASRHPAQNTAESIPLRVGDLLYVGDGIESAAGSKVRLRMHEARNALIIGENTYLEIEKAPTQKQIAKKARGSSFSLIRGEVRSVVTPGYYNFDREEFFEVRTSNAIAGVRGTSFYVAFDPMEYTSTLATLSGNVAFKGTKRFYLLVGAGYISRIVGDAKPSDPTPINMEAEKVQKSILATEFGEVEEIRSSDSVIR